jgi:phosphotriesterase-related protein
MSLDNTAAGIVMTVRGPVAPSDLGITLIHEHLFIDLQCWKLAPRTDLQREYAGKPLSMEILGEVRRDPLVFEDNLFMEDVELSLTEVLEFKNLGGQTVVDVTNRGIGQNVKALLEISERSGLHIVAGCGYYIRESHPPEVSGHSVESLADALMTDIIEGIEGSGIRPGVIGEIGTGDPVHDEEWKVLDAACAAQRESGLPLSVHVYPAQGTTAPEVVAHILARGVSPRKVIVCHMDGNMDLHYQVEVARTGVWISYDCFGLEVYFDGIDRYRCHDSERERVLLRLIENGYTSQLLLSQDVCMKAQLRKYGGYGYDHILRHIIPSLQRRGVPDETIRLLMVDNPREALTIG